MYQLTTHQVEGLNLIRLSHLTFIRISTKLLISLVSIYHKEVVKALNPDSCPDFWLTNHLLLIRITLVNLINHLMRLSRSEKQIARGQVPNQLLRRELLHQKSSTFSIRIMPIMFWITVYYIKYRFNIYIRRSARRRIRNYKAIYWLLLYGLLLGADMNN